MMNVVDPKQMPVKMWGKCPRCGRDLLVDEPYCPDCGAQRDWSEIIR